MPERREKITSLLREANEPLSATAIARKFGVSRQIIVGDIALLRAGGLRVLATPRGYLLEQEKNDRANDYTIVCNHDDSHLAEEIYTVIDLGGAMLDVIVEHSVYGQICAPLHIFSRYDADAFLKKIMSSDSRPLCDLTDGIHLHHIRCSSPEIFARIEQALDEKGFLVTRSEDGDATV